MKCSLRWSQIVLVSFLAFASQGVWNALNALGGGGTKEIATATKSNTILNASCFALGWTSGGIVNLIGPRLAMSLGVFTLGLLLTSFYLYAYHRAVPEWVPLLVAAVDGLGNTCMWSALGMVLMYYPRDTDRGKALTVFNVIFNLGGVGGAIIALVFNINSKESARELVTEEAGSLSANSYLGIISLTYAGLLLSFCLVNPVRFVAPAAREALSASTGALQELQGVLSAMKERTTAYMALVYCMTLWHEVFLYNWINAYYHNVRSRAFNSMLYWLSRMVFTLPLQFVLDRPTPSARINATQGATYLVVVLSIATTFGILLATLGPYKGAPPLFDLTDKEAGLTMAAMIFYGGLDTVAQGVVVWLISEYPGANAGSVARHSGLFRSLQGLGAMTAWALGINNVIPFRVQFIIATVLWFLALPGLFYVVRHFVSPFRQSHTASAEMGTPGRSFAGGSRSFAGGSIKMLGSMAEQVRLLSSSQIISTEMVLNADSDLLLNEPRARRTGQLGPDPSEGDSPRASFLNVPRQTFGARSA